jgi:hypothetical protein
MLSRLVEKLQCPKGFSSYGQIVAIVQAKRSLEAGRSPSHSNDANLVVFWQNLCKSEGLDIPACELLK